MSDVRFDFDLDLSSGDNLLDFESSSFKFIIRRKRLYSTLPNSVVPSRNYIGYTFEVEVMKYNKPISFIFMQNGREKVVTGSFMANKLSERVSFIVRQSLNAIVWK